MIRLFRADKPQDVAAAGLVASLAGESTQDFLVISADKTHAGHETFAQAMHDMAAGHPWRGIVDVSGLPLNQHWLVDDRHTRGSRWRVMQDQRTSARRLRELIGGMLSDAGVGGSDPLGRVEEVYAVCLSHADIQLMFSVLKNARIVSLPHGFDSIQDYEIEEYSPHVLGTGAASTPRHRALAAAKRLLFGRDAALPHRFPVEHVYTFNLAPPWNCPVTDISDRLDGRWIAELYAGLPANVRGYFDELAERAGPRVVVLLTTHAEQTPGHSFEADLSAMAKFAGQLMDVAETRNVLVKPHPINSAEWIDTVAERVESANPEASVSVLRAHHFLPAEVVLSPFDVAGVGGLGSTALKTIKLIHGWPTYCNMDLLRDIYSYDQTRLRLLDLWYQGQKDAFIAI